MYKRIYKRVTEKEVGQRDRGPWLLRSTLWPMVCQFAELSKSYGFQWSDSLKNHLDDMPWVGRAMLNTYGRLGSDDREKVDFEYDLFLEHDKFCDWQAMAFPSFDALCYVLDQEGRRVVSGGFFVTVVREVAGETKRDAMGRIETKCYEFIEWM